MKKLVFIFLISCFASELNAHEFYFSFAEVEYNEVSGKLEVSLSATAHDFDLYLEKKGVDVNPLESCGTDSLSLKLLEQEINSHLIFESTQENTITQGTEMIWLKLEGIEVLLNGIVYFYMSASVNQIPEELKIKFNLLMSVFSDQQNKMTFKYREQKYDLIFLKQEPSQTIKLYAKNEED